MNLGTAEMRRLIRSWIPVAVLVAAVGSGPAAVASVGPTGTAASDQHSRAQGTDVASRTARALAAAYASFRHIPAGDVSGVRPSSVRTAYARATRTYWATASFLPSARASARALLGFQDGGSIGVFSRREGSRWRMVGYGGQPVSCSASLPAAVRSSWYAGNSECSRVSGDRTRPRRLTTPGISGAVDPQTIAEVAEQNVGVGDTPASTSFSFDCNPFTTLVGVGVGSSGCGTDPKFKVQDRNEQWCADFTKWVWEQGGVTADLSTLTPSSASFYKWALDQGQHPSFDSGTPQVGDAIVFYPASDKAPNSTYADHVGLVVGVNSNGTLNLVNGDFAGSTNITVQQNNNVSPASWAGGIWGSGEHWIYVSPGGGYQIAFQANNNHLWYDTPTNSGHRDTGLGMATGTSPSIAASGEVAFQANNNHLYYYTPSNSGNRDTGLGMEGGTSPAITATSSGSPEIAFQANNHHLWYSTPTNSGSRDTGLGMDVASSPAIVSLPGGGYEIAFQANNFHLWLYTPTNSGSRDTSLGMDAASSPAITASASGSPEAAFRANNNHLWYYTTTNSGSRDTGLGMAPDTSPALPAP
jgi:CHAP domain